MSRAATEALEVETPSQYLAYYRSTLQPARESARRMMFGAAALALIAAASAIACALHNGITHDDIPGLVAAALALAVSGLTVASYRRDRATLALLDRLADLAEQGLEPPRRI